MTKTLGDFDGWTGQFVRKSTTYSMTVRDRLVAVTGATWTLTLPSVADTQGLVYTIYDADTTSTAVVTVDGKDSESILVNGAGFEASVALNAWGEFVILYSDGFCWHIIAREG